MHFAFTIILFLFKANYNPDEDDYYTKKSSNGFVTSNGVEEAGDNNNELVLRQPGRLDRHISVNR